MGRLHGKVALVTGAASGIGQATAARFVAEGASVVGFDLTGSADVEVVDVTDRAAVRTAVASVVGDHGRVDVLVQAAGVAGGGPLHLLADEEWQRVLAVNLTGTMLVAREVISQAMLPNRSGSVVNIASVEGLEGAEGGSAYNASKGGVVTLTKNMAMDYGRAGIRVNCICPGFIDTPMTAGIYGLPGMDVHRQRLVELHQLGRFGRPDEIAAGALFLASDDASFVTGHTLVIDGGYLAGHRTGVAELFGLG